MQKKTLFRLNRVSCDYLSSCDLINKYRLKSVYNKPKIKQIALSFSLKNFTTSVERLGIMSGKNSALMEIKSYLVFYLYFCNLPFLSFNLTSMNRSFEKLDSGDFVFKIVINNKKDIESFLFKFWVDSFNRLKVNSSSTNYTCSQACYSLSLTSKSFVDVEDIINVLNRESDSKDFDINLYFTFTNLNAYKNSKNLIRNIPFFWIND